jgi:hypothetical protein
MSWMEAAREAVDEASWKRRQRSKVRGITAVEGKRESVRERLDRDVRERERVDERESLRETSKNDEERGEDGSEELAWMNFARKNPIAPRTPA